MKQFIVCSMLVMTLVGYSQVQAQFKDPVNAWGVSMGGAQGDNAPGDKWVMQYRGYFQHEFMSALLGQVGVGYTDLNAPSYSAQVLMADLRLLYVPFSLPNLNPFLYAGLGLSKTLNIGNSNFLPMVPIGIGIQSRINSGLMLQVSGGYDLSLSDQLNGQTRSNSNLNSVTNNKEDGFFAFSLGLAFSLGDNNADEEEAQRVKDSTDAAVEANRINAANTALAQHVQDSTNAASEALRVKEANVAEARRIQDSTSASTAAAHVKDSTNAMVAATNVKDSTNAATAETLRLKDSTNAATLALSEQKNRDTLIVLIKGKTVILRGINFASNKTTLTDGSEIILMRAFNAMVANPGVRVVITGYTDNVGSEKSNQVLSLKRAQAVKNWLVSEGIASNRMRTIGRGENEPIASNKTDEGRSENRRMEFFVQ